MVGEEYISVSVTDVKPIVNQIIAAEPKVLLSTIEGEANIAFFNELRAQGVSVQKIPTMSFSIGEPELTFLKVADMVGDYATWNYFQSLKTERNITFVERFHAKYGEGRPIGDAMEAAYAATYLWAQAVERAATSDPTDVISKIKGASRAVPEGIISIDPETHHSWKTVRIGQIRSNGQFHVVWSSQRPVRPEPWPPSRTREQWEALKEALEYETVTQIDEGEQDANDLS